MTMDKMDNVTVAEEALASEAVFVDRSRLGMLKFRGETRLDLIHRMSTQDVISLQPYEGAATVLTTEIGRIIDRVILYVGQEEVYALTGEANGDAMARYLMRFVFFNDDFHIEDVGAETAVLAVYGAEAAARLIAAGAPAELTALPLHHWRTATLAGQTVYIARTDPLGGAGFLVMGDEGDKAELAAHLAAHGMQPVDETTFDALRVAGGMPRFGRELTGDYIPLEANLWDDISFSKGCYIGQEIIARMESRGQLAKKLVRLRPAAPVAAGTELQAGGRKAGVVTSAGEGADGPVALGYVRTAVLAAESALTAGEVPVVVFGEGGGVAAD